jgi:hypothetical protein
MPHARAVAKATVRAIKRDKAEIVIFPGPGRLVKALWDFYPGMGPSMNRMAGIDDLMERIAIARRLQRDQERADVPAA